MRSEHYLKTWPEYFGAVLDRRKLFELRKNDRDYRVNDVLVLAEYDPERQRESGRQIRARVAYVLAGPAAEQFGLQPGYCVMDIEPISTKSTTD